MPCDVIIADVRLTVPDASGVEDVYVCGLGGGDGDEVEVQTKRGRDITRRTLNKDSDIGKRIRQGIYQRASPAARPDVWGCRLVIPG